MYFSYLNQFTQPDTIVPDLNNPQDWNRYAYARNNPIRYNDPTGHDPAGDCYDRGYCTKKEALHKELDNFVEPKRVKDDEMVLYLLTPLSPEEINVINSHKNPLIGLNTGILSNMAGSAAEETFPNFKPPHNDPADAFRHTYWNALLTRTFGVDFAKAFTTAHETEYANPENITNPRAESFMDLHNNQVGRNIASANPKATNGQLQDLVMDALVSGQLLVWDGNDIYYSDECPQCNYP